MTVLTALTEYYDRLSRRGHAPPCGYSYESIAFEVVLNKLGTPLQIIDLRVGSRLRSRRLMVPNFLEDRTSDVRPHFLWDNTAYALGLSRQNKKRRTTERHKAYINFHLTHLKCTRDDDLVAFNAFLRGWRPEQFWSLGGVEDLLDRNLVFRMEGDRDNGFLHERREARNIWDRLSLPTEKHVHCLVSGTTRPAARLHAKVRGIAGAPSTGASLVSYNRPAYCSFGKEGGDNAPVSAESAFKYGTALRSLLAPGSGRNIRIAQTTIVFWADAKETNEASAEAAERELAWCMGGDVADADCDKHRTAWWTTQLPTRHKLGLSSSRAPIDDIPTAHAEELNSALDPQTRVFILGISPNKSRLLVRLWHEERFGRLAANLKRHFEDLRIVPDPFRRPPGPLSLLTATSPLGSTAHIQPQLEGELLRAILAGTRYPVPLLVATLHRLRAEGDVHHLVAGSRAAICKAIITRNVRDDEARKNDLEETPLVSLDKTNAHPAYRLGRLFALYEWAQREAQGRSASMREKYFAAASAAPARVFPQLIRRATYNLSQLRNGSGHAVALLIDREIGGVFEALPDPLPRYLPLEDQGRFVIGYYHQSQARFAKRNVHATPTPGEEALA